MALQPGANTDAPQQVGRGVERVNKEKYILKRTKELGKPGDNLDQVGISH